MENKSEFVLGKRTIYPEKYSPELLFRIARIVNRKIYGIDAGLFLGYDIWNAYEFSFLTLRGLPVVGILKIKYSCTSEYIVESKSLKLYLNSFNMSTYGKTPKEGIIEVETKIQTDLQELLETVVEINYFSEEEVIASKEQFVTHEWNAYKKIENIIDPEKIVIDQYTEKVELLIPSSNNASQLQMYTDLLRSKCKVTMQPDWGSVFIYMKGEILPDEESFLKYIVSLRDEQHFHEEICELIYHRLQSIFIPEKLMVTCLYTRRGGIDICPVRTNDPSIELPQFGNMNKVNTKRYRQ